MYVYSLLGVCGEMGSDASQRTEPWTSHRSRLHEVLHEGGQEGSGAMKLTKPWVMQPGSTQPCPIVPCNHNYPSLHVL